MKLVLTFISPHEAVLHSVFFQRDAHEPRYVVRGKQVSSRIADGTFQWSAAVRAFAQLVVGSCLTHENESFVLSGEKGSAAASLDYAISKPTRWILEMFGEMQEGKPFAQRVFDRRNSEGKRPGPIEVFLRNAADKKNIRVEYINHHVLNHEELMHLFEALGGESAQVQVHAEELRSQRISLPLQQAFHEEAKASLSEVGLLEPYGVAQFKTRLHTLPWVAEKISESLCARLSESLPDQQARYAMSDDELWTDIAPCKIQVLPLALGALLLLRYVKNKGAPIELSYQFAGSSDMQQELSEEVSKGSVLSIGAYCKAYQEGRPLQAAMLLPRTGFLLLDATVDAHRSHLFIPSHEQGYPFQLYQGLLKEGVLDTTLTHSRCTLAEATIVLQKKKGSVIVGFPFSRLLQSLPGVSAVGMKDESQLPGENILCLPSSYDAEGLLKGIRSAWYALLESEELRKGLLEKLLEEPEYCQYIRRLGGLYALDELPI